MKNRRLRLFSSAICLGLAGLLMGPAFGGASATVNPIKGTIVSPFDNGVVHGIRFVPEGLQGPGPGKSAATTTLYDNVPTAAGGQGTIGGTISGLPGGYAFADWVAPGAAWGDDLHGMVTGATLTALRYSYLNTLATGTHTIRLYDMVPPSGTHGAATGLIIDKGALLTSIVIPGLPPGTNSVSVGGLNLPLPNSAAWISFAESGAGAPGTFWQTGGNPGVGTSHAGLNYTAVGYDAWVPIPYLNFGGGYYINSNIVTSLHGMVNNPTPEGACCTNGPGTQSECIVTTQLDCETNHSLYLGDGTTCTGDLDCELLFVEFDSLSAVATRDGVHLRWTTLTEVDTVGFRILRESVSAEKSLFTVANLIPAAGFGLTGATYEFLDNSKQARSALAYYVEDIDIRGKVTRHGPLFVQRGGRTDEDSGLAARKR